MKRDVAMEKGPDQRLQTGFTIIEAIVVIAIVGIVSAMVMSRFLRSDAYDAIIVRDSVVSMARAAQQKALGRDDIELTITPAGDTLAIVISDSTGAVQSTRVDARRVLLGGDVNALDSCAVSPGAGAVTAASPFVLRFISPGDLQAGGVAGVAGFPISISSGARLCINNTAAMSVCWSASGYAYTGDCIE